MGVLIAILRSFCFVYIYLDEEPFCICMDDLIIYVIILLLLCLAAAAQ
jgi:hypothetical protein